VSGSSIISIIDQARVALAGLIVVVALLKLLLIQF
jgi:hypothetical protein